MNTGLANSNQSVLADTDPLSVQLGDDIKRVRQQHLDDLSTGNVPPAVSVALLASLNAYARVRDHIRNIAETCSGEK